MKSSNHTSMPEFLKEALSGKPAEERERAARVWQLLAHAEKESLDVPDTNQALAELERVLYEAPATSSRLAPDRSPQRPTRRRRRWISTAAVCFLALCAAVTWIWKSPVVLSTAPGQQITATLPDGSKVELNSGSRIEYARRFETWPLLDAPVRNVRLSGEAFFEVEPGSRPFIVHSFNAQVRALGTGFNVRTYNEGVNPATEITLTHGSIEVTSEYIQDQSVILTERGESVRVVTTPGNIDRRTHNLDYVLAWRNQGFVVVDRPFSEVIEEFERRYGLTIEIGSNITKTDSLTVLLTNPTSAENIVQDICLTLSCNYRRTSEGFAIY